MSLVESLERAAEALPTDADSIHPANGDPRQLLRLLDGDESMGGVKKPYDPRIHFVLIRDAYLDANPGNQELASWLDAPDAPGAPADGAVARNCAKISSLTRMSPSSSPHMALSPF